MAHCIQTYTGDTALSHTLTFGEVSHLDEIRLHMNSAATAAENFTVTLDSYAGSAYDTLLVTHDMKDVQDLQLIGTEEIRFQPSDKLVMAYTNTDSYLYGLEVRFTT